MPSRPRPRSRVLGTTIALALAMPLTGCTISPAFVDGDAFATRGAEDMAAQIGSRTDNTGETTIEEMVVGWLPRGTAAIAPRGVATVDALAWSGRIGPQSEATIDVRIHVEVDAYSSPGFGGGTSNSAGEATACYRLVWHPYEQAARSEIDCPDGAAPPRPELPERPELTEDDTARVAQILTDTGELDAVEAALREAFPHGNHRIEAVTWSDETVVAVGIPAERDCILVVRDAAGDLSYPPYRRVSLEPGEVGCSTRLYTNPSF